LIDALVVGAGAAGLAAALELRRAGLDVRLLEASLRPGGVMHSDSTQGFLFERGPNTMQLKAPALAFLRSHDLASALVPAAPASRLRFLWYGGRLEPVPMGPGAFLRTPLLSPRGKLRLLAEPFVARGDGSGESVAGFVSRRLGDEALERLVAPFLTGVYAGDETQLGAAAVFGRLVELEREHGSIVGGFVRGALRRSGAAREQGLAGSFSGVGGFGAFAAHLAAPLGEAVATGVRVISLRRDDTTWCLETEGGGGGQPLRAARVVLAVSANDAAGLLRSLDAEAADLLAGILYAPIANLSLGLSRGDAARRIEGFGFLVPRGAGLDLLGCLFMSQLFAGRAPEGKELLTCFLGGVRWPAAVDAPDDELLRRVVKDLGATLGLRGAPELLAVTRWPRAVPQPARDHAARITRLRARVSRQQGLALAGSYLDGVSVADTLACGVRAAREVLSR
jgi:oxygen-dependent protoporphyrinogen oxidase